MNPLGLAVTAIASGALLIIQHWNTIKPFMTSLWEDVKKIFSGAWGVITGLFTGNFDRVKNGFKTMFDGIGTIATSFFDKLKITMELGHRKIHHNETMVRHRRQPEPTHHRHRRRTPRSNGAHAAIGATT
ncbi:hypothetical protein [Xylella fastidiosa]|uniref:hypothetical protein n=1 Tax=Xylella fastidiosa TaxID=2371 RepID=UPI0035D4D2DE